MDDVATRQETHHEESQTNVQLERSVRLLALGVEHIVLSGPSVVHSQEGSLVRHTMIRRFPKLGCGVPEGMGAGAVVVGARAILGGEESKRIGGRAGNGE